MNDGRHQGAKCPVQDIVGIFLLTGGNNICLAAESIADSSVSRAHLILKSQLSNFRNAPKEQPR